MNSFKNAVVLLTGAGGDIGKAFIDELLMRDVSKWQHMFLLNR
ncbi:hypothetical protein [Flavobacterium tistrianum]|nr:hypothetical protein [Flavobacterium tistrianum]